MSVLLAGFSLIITEEVATLAQGNFYFDKEGRELLDFNLKTQKPK